MYVAFGDGVASFFSLFSPSFFFCLATIKNQTPISVKINIIRKTATIVKTETTVLGGIDTLVGILNQVDRTTEKNITESLQEQDYELAEKIKSCMFVFEDILTLDDVAIQRILRDVETKELALALKGASEEVANAIYKNQSKRAAASLKEDIEYLGPVRLTDVEKAQQQIVAVIRRLEDAQEIIISRGGEDALIM